MGVYLRCLRHEAGKDLSKALQGGVVSSGVVAAAWVLTGHQELQLNCDCNISDVDREFSTNHTQQKQWTNFLIGLSGYGKLL